MVLPNPFFTIVTKIDTKVVLVNSLSECSRGYRGNKKLRIIIDTVLEVEIGLKATTLGRRRTFVIAKFDLGG